MFRCIFIEDLGKESRGGLALTDDREKHPTPGFDGAPETLFATA
jgi:hypothetical protein